MPQRESQLPFSGGEGKSLRIHKTGGINHHSLRPAIPDDDFYWLENLQPIADGNLTALYSNGLPIYTAPVGLTIIYKYYYNIGANNFVAVFLNDGTAYQINTSTASSTTISSIPGTFYPGSAALGNPLPSVSQWANSGIIIVATVTADSYWAWDGAILYAAGNAAPSWLTNSTPTTMPTGVSGTSIETYQNRAWVTNGALFYTSAPGNGANFSGPSGGVTTPSTDSFLKREYTVVRQSNGFLYLFGDSSINVISNVQSSGTPLTTTFNNQNVDPQTGTPWHNSVQAFGRGLIFANPSGVYALFGGAAEKVSADLDGFFAAAQTTLAQATSISQPSSAVAIINGVRCYMLTLPVNDPFTGNVRTVACIWNGKKWFLGSQDLPLTFIATQEINSAMTAWGTDGNSLFSLFTRPTTTLKKIIQSKLWQGERFDIIKQVTRLFAMIQDNGGSGYSLTGTLDLQLETGGNSKAITLTSASNRLIFTNATGGIIQFQNASGQNIFFTIAGLTLKGQDAACIGNLVGLTLQSTSQDFTVIELMLRYYNQTPSG